MSKENNLKEESKFSSQQFLLSHIDDILNNIQPEYNNIHQLDTTTKSLPEILALVNGKSDSIPFTKLETHQNAALIPKIRLYRVEPTTAGDQGVELEYIFFKDSRFGYVNDNILGGNYIKGDNAGIKSFNWTFAGTNPVTAQNCIEVSMELFFDSLAAFSGGSYDVMLELWKNAPEDSKAFRNNSPFDDYEKLITNNYWALVYHPAFKKKRDGYDSIYYRTKVVVGWNDIEPSIKNELFKHPKFANIQDDIEDMNISMYLNLVSHDFTFNEDGTIKLKLDYKGSLENSLFSERNNLFIDLTTGMSLKEALESLKYKTNNALVATSTDAGSTLGRTTTSDQVNQTYAAQQAKLKFLSYIKDNNDTDKLASELASCGYDDAESTILQLKDLVTTDKYASILGENQKILDLIQSNLEAAEVSTKNLYYSILTKQLFLKRTFANPAHGGINNKIYKIVLNAQQIKDWVTWKNTKSKGPPPNIFSGGSPITENEQSSTDAVKVSLDELRDTATNYFNTDTDKYSELADKLKNKEETIEDKTIYFTTIGHLIDIAYAISITSNDKNKDNTYNKIIFTNFSQDSETNILSKNIKQKLKSIANIPVDLNMFINHMVEEVYKPLKDSYTFYQFLKDIIVKIIEPSLNQKDSNDDNINKYANTSLATTIFSLQSGPKSTKNPLQQFISSTDPQNIIDLKGQNRSTFRPYLIKGNLEKGSKYYNYYLIYDKYLKDFKGIGDQIQDEAKGIYHYTVAQAYGLVKSITFKKVDQPFLREAKSVGKKTMFLGQFRDIYSADIKMVGNNIYNNGMLLFLKPSVEFGNPVSSNPSNPTFSQLTGVGGYYSVIKVENSITENGYETTLNCLFHSNDGLAPEGNKGCNLEELQKLGFVKEESTDLDSNFLNIIAELAKIEEVLPLQTSTNEALTPSPVVSTTVKVE